MIYTVYIYIYMHLPSHKFLLLLWALPKTVSKTSVFFFFFSFKQNGDVWHRRISFGLVVGFGLLVEFFFFFFLNLFSYKHICHADTQRHGLKQKHFQLNELHRTWSWNRHFDIPQKLTVWHHRYIENHGLVHCCHTCLCWGEGFVIKKGDRPFIRHSCPFSPRWGLSYRSLSSPEPWSIFRQTAISLRDKEETKKKLEVCYLWSFCNRP